MTVASVGERINDDGRLSQRAWYFSTILADPKDVDTVYAENTGLFRSTDGGKTFELLPARHGDHHGLWIDPTNTDRIIEASDGGASISFDRGKSWSTVYNQPTAQFYHVSVDNRFPYYVYGAQQDNSSVAIASMDDEGAILARDWYDVGRRRSRLCARRSARCRYRLWDEREFHQPVQQTNDAVAGHLGVAGRCVGARGQGPRTSLQLDIAAGYVAVRSGHALLRHGAPLQDDRRWHELDCHQPRSDTQRQVQAGASGGPITKDITSVEYYDTIFAIAESPLARE